jgi:hypothetical protein
MDASQRRKSSGGRKAGYKSKSHVLEVQARDKEAFLGKLQAENGFLQLKAQVLTNLLEVASEIAVHKRSHIDVRFPDLSDAQLVEYLDDFLSNYGGYNAERPTGRNALQLERYWPDSHSALQL